MNILRKLSKAVRLIAWVGEKNSARKKEKLTTTWTMRRKHEFVRGN